MSQNLRLLKLFKAQFGREPTEQEIVMLQKERMSKALFMEWLSRKFDTQVSAPLETRFVRKFKENHGPHWGRFDIFWREVNAQSPQKARRASKAIEATWEAVLEERRDNASLQVLTTTTPITLGIRVSGSHSGTQRRTTEDRALIRN